MFYLGPDYGAYGERREYAHLFWLSTLRPIYLSVEHPCMFFPASYYAFATNRSSAEITHDEMADISSAMQAARQAFFRNFDTTLMTCSHEDWRSVLRRSDESFPEWVWMDLSPTAQAVHEEVKSGRLIFVPTHEDLRACVKIIQEDRQKQRSPQNLHTRLPESTPLGNAQPIEYVPDSPRQAVDFMAGGEGTPGNNQAQNKQFKAVVKALGLNKNQAQELHLEISKQRLGYHEIMERAQDIFGGSGD